MIIRLVKVTLNQNIHNAEYVTKVLNMVERII